MLYTDAEVWTNSCDVYEWISAHGYTRPAKTYMDQLCLDIRCRLDVVMSKG